MRVLALAITLLLGLVLPALPQVSPPTYISAAYNYLNITTDATTTISSGPAVLGEVCINTTAAGETITIYDNTSGSGTKVGTITLAAASGGCFNYNSYMKTGLTIVTAVAAADLTVVWRPAP